MTSVARRFFLGDTEEGLYPLDAMDLQNTGNPWDDPSNKDRLKFIYQPNTKYGLNGREFTPEFGGGGSNFYGGGMGNSSMQFNGPRVDPTFPGDQSSSGSCPYGFYWYNGICVPGATLDPNSQSFLGNKPGGGPSKGKIANIQPPKVTYTNQPFQLAIQVQNVGGKPGDYAIRTSIPELNISNVLSPKAYINPGQNQWIYQTISFSNIPSGTLQNRVIQATVDLVRLEQVTTGGEITYVLEDQNRVTIPSPLLSTMPVGPPQGIPINGYSPFPPGMGPPGMPMPRPPWMGGGGGGAFPTSPPSSGGYQPLRIFFNPSKQQYKYGESVMVFASGFAPYERVTVKFDGGSSHGMGHGQVIVKPSQCDERGQIKPVNMPIPATNNSIAYVTVTGTQSGRKGN